MDVGLIVIPLIMSSTQQNSAPVDRYNIPREIIQTTYFSVIYYVYV